MDVRQIIAMIRGGANPQQVMMQFLEGNLRGTPMGDNLINLARNGQTAEIEKIARNIAAQQGVDYDREFEAFKNSFGFRR